MSFSILKWLFPLIMCAGCMEVQIENNNTHGTSGDIGEESATPTTNTTVNPNINVPIPGVGK